MHLFRYFDGGFCPVGTASELPINGLRHQLSSFTDEAGQRIIVDQISVIVDEYYVNLLLKKSLFGIDPSRRLEMLRRRIGTMSGLQFMTELCDIFPWLQDRHFRPAISQYGSKGVYLPFEVRQIWENGKPKFVAHNVQQPTYEFDNGVTITHWNGYPIGSLCGICGSKMGN